MTSSIRFSASNPIMSTFSPSSTRSSNPFRRNKQAQILGIDNPNFGTSSDDVSSIRSGLSNHSLGVERKVSKTSRGFSSHALDLDSASIAYSKRSSNSGDDASSFSTSMYNAHSPIEEDGNPFEEELTEEEDSLDELEPAPGLRRRRTVPSKAGTVTDANQDNLWRAPSKLGTHPSLRRPNRSDGADGNLIPLKAQKTLGISKRGKLMTEEEFRRNHSLSPDMDNVAPKAQKMLGIPSNPFQKKQPTDGNRQTFGDELEQHGAKGPTSLHKRPMDVDDFKRMLLSGDRDSLLSAADSHVDTPRSSHDLTSRPGLPRIATDPYDPNNANHHPVSPSELADNSPAALNKPLPAPPSTTFELAGSAPAPRIPDPSTRRRLQQHKRGDPWRQQNNQVHEMPATMEFAAVELPAEPVQSIQAVLSQEKPGSETMPIELPAREATPIEAPQRHPSRPAPLHIAALARSPPAVPPPRRAGSHRTSVAMPQGIPELGEKSPDPAKQSFEPHETPDARKPFAARPADEEAKPPVPPPRSLERRLDRSTANSLPPSNIRQEHPAQRPDGSWHIESIEAYLRDPSPQQANSMAPPPPPRRRESHGPVEKEVHSQDAPESGDWRRGVVGTTAQLPRLQTRASRLGNMGPDPLVSALSVDSRSRQTMSPVDNISLISATGSPVGRMSSLASIANAVSANAQFIIPGNDSNLGPGRRPSRHETLQVLDRVVHDDTRTEKEKIDVLADLGALQREVDALRRSYEGGHSAIPEEDEGEGRTPASAAARWERTQEARRDSEAEAAKHAEQALGAGGQGKSFLAGSRNDYDCSDTKGGARDGAWTESSDEATAQI